MKQINASHTEFFGVLGTKFLRGAEGIRPRDGQVDEDGGSQIRFDFKQCQSPLLDVDLTAEDAEPNRVAQFESMQRRKWQRILRLLHPGQRLPGVRMGRVDASQKTRIGVRDHGNDEENMRQSEASGRVGLPLLDHNITRYD